MRNDIEAEIIMAIFDALINVDTHKEEFGFNAFHQFRIFSRIHNERFDGLF